MKGQVLITGGAGFIGLHLARRLLDQGFEVTLVDNFSRAIEDADLAAVASQRGATLHTVDLMSRSEVEALGSNFTAIFHLAAIIGVAHVLERPYQVLTDNVALLSNVIDLSRRQRHLRRLLFASTSEVYAGSAQVFELPIPTSENIAICIPGREEARTSYMLSKLYGEAMCLQSGLPVTIFRPHNIYGPRMGMSHVIPELCARARDLPDAGVLTVASPEHTRTFCYVSDAVEQLLRIFSSDECEGQIVNIGSQAPEIKIREVAGKILLATGREDLFLALGPDTPGSPSRRCPDMSHLISLVGEHTPVDLGKGIAITYKWYQQHVFGPGGKTAR